MEEDEYPLVPNLAYILHTFRGSLGESGAPKYNYWIELQKFLVS